MGGRGTGEIWGRGGMGDRVRAEIRGLWSRRSKAKRKKEAIDMIAVCTIFQVPLSEQAAFKLPALVAKKLEYYAFCLFDKN